LIDKIDWKKNNGLVPVIVQDSSTNEVLMLAYMNKEALNLTLNSGYAHYFSRSKNRIWKKGESSGHTQKIIDILVDCDNDTILLKVEQNGVACHTGRKSCFFTSIKQNKKILDVEVNLDEKYSIIDRLYHTILEKLDANPEISYTAKLAQGKENSLLKKIVEEAGELCFAIKDKDRGEIIYEGADLVYHVLVALAKERIDPDLIKQELKRRFGISGIEEKKSRKK